MVDRLLPTAEAADFLQLIEEWSESELVPRAPGSDRAGTFPRDVFRQIGGLGMFGLPYPVEYDGGDQPYEVYLQALEVIGGAWASVAVGVSVHVLSCYPLATFGSAAQRERWLPTMIGGDLLGAYCLSETHAGSDPAAMRTTATRDGDVYRLTGAKAWTTHGGEADFYTVMARTAAGPKGISCFHVPADLPGISAAPGERKMGLTSSRTSTVSFDDTPVPVENLIGEEGQGLSIALSALDSGRLGISAVATGLSQAALDLAVGYAKQREAFGVPIIRHEGLAFLLADMAAAVAASRATYLAAARRRDAGLPFGVDAAIAKITATDNAMKVATDAVQVLGGAGYTQDFPAERYMRDAKVMQIFEGTNQVQRVVISRALERAS
ncbi:acyl-CoA dehydrogenase family protein [Microbacterium sp. No. 7]|uniref:acyl-CoA dehydrogenase family protein n=1 Tax=Microbacterium sp. No. 7 TaxID=1714373 RepID=UPI0006D1B006|nr:acyl-CoA dehydrogenase family protein [Microbacterium sp. No. 7]ALJ21880.1 acyl-CoA dehydrogenase [Microbacterium sp. No. 7]